MNVQDPNRNYEKMPKAMHHYNPSFMDISADRNSMNESQVESAHSGQHEQWRLREKSDTWMSMEGSQMTSQKQIPHTRYGIRKRKDVEYDMENLLKRLPSRHLESVANNAAKTLYHRHCRKRSLLETHHHGILEHEEILPDLKGGPTLFTQSDEEMLQNALRSKATGITARHSVINEMQIRKQGTPSFIKRMKYRVGMGWKHTQNKMADLQYTMQLWHSHLKRIEGNFGTDVLSYFVFLKWLLLINIPTLLLTLGFIVVPQIIYRWLQQKPRGFIGNEEFTGKELLTGATIVGDGLVANSNFRHIASKFIGSQGWFSPTELYYGSYTNETIEVIGGTQYDMQVAYLFTCGGYYLLTLFVLGYRLADDIIVLNESTQGKLIGTNRTPLGTCINQKGIRSGGCRVLTSILRSYRKYYIEVGDFNSMHIIFKLLGSWDYGLTSAEAVRLKHKSTYNQLKEYLAGINKISVKKTLRNWCMLFWLRILTNFLVLSLIACAGYLVFFLSQKQESLTAVNKTWTAVLPIINKTLTAVLPIINKTLTVPGLPYDDANDPWLLLVLPLGIGIAHSILPILFTFIEGYERYENPRSELYMHLIRSMLLRMSTLAVLVYYWYTMMAPSQAEKCWETFMGQELYRLVIVDSIFTLISTFFLEFCRRLLASRITRLEHPTFSIGRNTLELIYSQALCWLGTFYAPLVSLVVIIKLVIIFYVKMISVLMNCKPSVRPWRAARSHTIFLAFLFFFFILTATAVTCGIVFVKPSKECGPYQGKDKMYSVVPELVKSWSDAQPWFRKVINFVSSPGFIAAILIALGMGAYIVYTIMNAHKEAVVRMKEQLLLEGKDKTFLLNLLNKVSLRQSTTTVFAGERPLTQQLPTKADKTSPGGRVFIRRIAESAIR